MGRRSSNKDAARYEGDDSALSSNPFAALAGSQETPEAPATESSSPNDDASEAASSSDPFSAAHLVVRKERKGHGGKTVTVIEGWTCEADSLETVARQLRKALGCSGRVHDGRVIVGGERQPQVADWLRAAGARRVTIGN